MRAVEVRSDRRSVGTRKRVKGQGRSNSKLRIACYGYAERDAGSISSAGHAVLEELLARGHNIDFFGKRSFAYPVGFDQFEKFRFIQTEGVIERWLGRRATGPFLKRQLAGMLLNQQTQINIYRAIEKSHRHDPYDVCYYHGLWPFGRVAGLQQVCWVQGARGSDARSVKRQKKLIRQCEGQLRYLMLRSYAVASTFLARRADRFADQVICGSRWSADQLQKMERRLLRVQPSPYPVDLTRFRPHLSRSSSSRVTLLWVGRIVPRKRLDLFLDAASQLIDEGRDINLRVCGQFGFAPRLRRLTDTFKHKSRLHYSPSVPQSELSSLYNAATLLIQPSEEEDFGSAVAEALACGTPVVIGPTNGTADYTEDCGFRFAEYSTGSLAKTIADAIDQVQARPDRFAKCARSIAERQFNVQSVVDRVEGLLAMPRGSRSAPAVESIETATA